MEKLNKMYNYNNSDSSFAVNKIQSFDYDNNLNIENDKNTDKIKILELCNTIDNWEKEVLFSQNGFFALKGIEVKNKSKECIEELEKFINSIINKMDLVLPQSKEAVCQIKKLKIDNIKKQILDYESKELFEWEISVYDNALESSVSRALLYKNNPEIIKMSFQNAISILGLMRNREKWNEKIYQAQKSRFIAKFYYSIIRDFLNDKDIKFFIYFEKYKDCLTDEYRNELDNYVNELKQNIIAFNWTKEISSYNISDEEIDKEIAAINDVDLEASVRSFLDLLKKQKKKIDERQQYDISLKSWENVMSLAENEPEKALLFIDLSQKKSTVKAQKDYINKIAKDNLIYTDKSQFIDLLKDFIDNPIKFKFKQLADFRCLLSSVDFDFFEKLQKESDNNLLCIYSDFKYILNKLEQVNIKNKDKLYDSIILFINTLSKYKEITSKEADLEKKNKIIDLILERNLKENNTEKKREIKKDDSIINKSCE